MKATELMIGDWVMRKDSLFPLRITAIRDKRYCPKSDNLISTDGASEDWSSLDYYEPIPLTPEILEKNGFENDSSYDECVADGQFITIQIWSYSAENVLRQWDGSTCEVINDIGYPCEKITLHGENYEHDIYVHQLQHALRLCGLDELANNFKI